MKKVSKKATKRLTAAAAIKDGKHIKVYRLKNGIPKDLAKPSAGRAILESISKHHAATADTIRRDMKKGYPDSTLRFYLGKFQRERVVVAKSIV